MEVISLFSNKVAYLPLDIISIFTVSLLELIAYSMDADAIEISFDILALFEKGV